jgi:glycosyltransferase involved in cell wall biosynthesis
MAARLPVLTTAACKLPGAAEGGALRCVADDSRAFSEQLDLLMDDEAERRALGLRGRSWVEANLSWESVLRVHDGAYRRAAKRRR